MRFYRIFLVVVVCLLINTNKVYSATNDQSKFGTSTDYSESYTEDYANGVELAFPHYKNEELGRFLATIVNSESFDPIKIRSLREIESFFALPPIDLKEGQLAIETEQYAYEIDPTNGGVYFHEKQKEEKSLPLPTAEELKDRFSSFHNTFLENIGIDSSQILYKETSFTLLQAISNPEMDPIEETIPVVDSIFTYALRSLDGFIVEGSYAKIVSNDFNQIETLELVWPRFQLYPQLADFCSRNNCFLKDQEELKRQILAKVKQSANGNEVNIKMAVVLRPILNGYFTPSMRVGVMPNNNEAGEIFYVELIDQEYPDENEKENPLFVELSSFNVEEQDGNVLIKWETATEIYSMGFYLWRAQAKNGTFVNITRVTDQLLNSEGRISGASYSYKDYNVKNGKTYYYALEEIDSSGISTIHTDFIDSVTIQHRHF
ncbi:MAG: hypothetical protein HC877_01465 [Thioploca sp.]|nr:hypothetical protein [Thioploca sp.]